MYIPAHFAVDPDAADATLSRGGLAHLITSTPDGLQATPLPLLFDADRRTLCGHLARNNPHWRVLADGPSLAIFAGADTYISPSLYVSKAEHGRVVPTWNYEVVHVHGHAQAHDDVDWLGAHVTALTAQHESRRAHPWQPSDAPEDFVAGQLRAIVGVELHIERVEAKAKLSQNRTAADQDSVRAALAVSPNPADVAVAAAMGARRTP